MRRLLATLFVVGAWAGCTSYGENAPTGHDAGSLPDGTTDSSTTDELVLPESDGGVSDLDANVGTDGGCSFADNFTSGVGAGWSVIGNAKASSAGNNGFVTLVDGKNQRGALFRTFDLGVTGFDATFSFRALRPSASGNAGDGVALVWLTDGAVASLADMLGGGGLGMPRSIPGQGLIVDTYRNLNLGDLDVPFFSLVKIDPSRGNPGNYDWHLKKVGPYSGVYDAFHSVKVGFKDGKLTASVLGVKIFDDVIGTLAPIRALGFTAANGDTTPLTVSIDAVSVSLTGTGCP